MILPVLTQNNVFVIPDKSGRPGHQTDVKCWEVGKHEQVLGDENKVVK